MQQLIHDITKEQLRTDLPDFRPGDTVRVHVKVVEGTRERIQIFEGGYLATNIGGKLHIFDIGKEAATMLIEDGKALSPATGGVTVYDGEVSEGYIPVETTGETAVDPYMPEPIGT